MNNEQETTGNEENKAASEPHQETWIEKVLDNINVDFPLSGGEQNEDLILWEEKDLTPEQRAAKEKELKEGLENNFPLSGGETEKS